ncbi:MAG: TetR/AcrR family transcriptional regulator, partial [Clostridia bacterium]|nr:TetR/AcrR family transcriptional regulator [Clostridia bacterium]
MVFQYCACAEGLKKTTLEELTHSAGISKSAFYAFYPSKEHLFLQVHARWHREIFDHALQALEEAQSLPPRERAAYILEKTLHALSQSDMFKNALEDFPLLERKLPPEEIQALSKADSLLVTELIERARITLLTS